MSKGENCAGTMEETLLVLLMVGILHPILYPAYFDSLLASHPTLDGLNAGSLYVTNATQQTMSTLTHYRGKRSLGQADSGHMKIAGNCVTGGCI